MTNINTTAPVTQNTSSNITESTPRTGTEVATSTTDALKTRINKLQESANSKRNSQTGASKSNRTNDANRSGQIQASCGAQGGTGNQRSLTIELNKDIDEAKKIMREIKEADNIGQEDKKKMLKDLRGAFETLDSIFSLEQQLLNASVQQADSQARADRTFVENMTDKERRKDKGASNEQARNSEVHAGNLRSDLSLAQSNKLQTQGFLQTINATITGYEVNSVFSNRYLT